MPPAFRWPDVPRSCVRRAAAARPADVVSTTLLAAALVTSAGAPPGLPTGDAIPAWARLLATILLAWDRMDWPRPASCCVTAPVFVHCRLVCSATCPFTIVLML